MFLSNIFKFTEGLRQDGHQIGRKVGDALELLTFGMIERETTLLEHLVVENGIKGATSAEHKVEFAFYQKGEDNAPDKNPDNLFGLIECKKVGVEQTINNRYKTWKSNNPIFHATRGYNFTLNPTNIENRWEISITPLTGNNNLRCCVNMNREETLTNVFSQDYNLNVNDRILVVIDVEGRLFILGPNEYLSSISSNIQTCKTIKAIQVESNKINKLIIEDALPGPQTPEKAKQASFVSLDVRKRVLGHFDKSDDDKDNFISILVIGEASHWEGKSRSMIRLCNDYNLVVPDNAIVRLFEKFEAKFGVGYQDNITKSLYQTNEDVKTIVSEIIDEFNVHILMDLDSGHWVKFNCNMVNNKSHLQVVEI